LLVDCVFEVYHFVKINQDENFQKYIKVRQGIVRNDKLSPFLLGVMQDPGQPEVIKEKVFSLIIKMIR
jgi:hypothetical protein